MDNVGSIVRLGDGFEIYGCLPFGSRGEAERWLEKLGFESQQTQSGTKWVLNGPATLKLQGETRRVSGGFIAGVYDLISVEKLGFKPV